MTLCDPVPVAARTELERLARRWQQLPLDRALAHVPAVRALAQRYADLAGQRSAHPAGPRPVDARQHREVPDLGPGSVIDQLTVTTYDLAATHPGHAARLAEELADLRRRIG